MKNGFRISLSIVFLVLIVGCGSGGNPRDRNGVLAVSLTDAPACGFDQVNVTVSKVQVHPSAAAGEGEEGWSEIVLSPPRKIDLLSLTSGRLEPLGTTLLAPGHYTQLRLVFLPNTADAPLNNSVMPTGGSETPLERPTGVESGIRLIHEFDMDGRGRADLVFDLDACRSVVQRGDGAFLFKPVVSVISQEGSGEIRGVIGKELTTGLPLQNPRIIAQQAGRVVKATLPDPSGSFVLHPLVQSASAGNYDLIFTADNAAPAVIQSVPVFARETTTVATSENPILLRPSAIRTVSGTVTPTAAVVRAVQRFAPDGPSVEIRSANTLIDSGHYSIMLPVDAPSLGLFGTGMLPIVLNLRPDAAGSYMLEVSSEGATTETRPVTLLGSDLTENFVLLP